MADRTQLMYSIQGTYILKPVYKSENTIPKHIIKSEHEPEITILTCDQRIDIPTIEPLTDIKSILAPGGFLKIIPCVELAGKFLDEFNLEFETNEGVTVLPVNIGDLENPYLNPRYVLVLPRGATGVKSCKIIHKPTGKKVQHNFTFGIMPPAYNYDNALLGLLSYYVESNSDSIDVIDNQINILNEEVTNLKARVTALENKAGG